MADEYIKKQDAVKGLEDSEIGFCDDEPIQTRNRALKIIKSIPAADVRPVVLCKDCKYFHKESGKCLNIDGIAKQLDSTDFCSCGVRREVDDE